MLTKTRVDAEIPLAADAVAENPLAEIDLQVDGLGDIYQIEDAIRKLEPLDLPVEHHFSHGLYARELFIPKGCILTGKRHRFQNMNMLIAGDITVSTDGGYKRIKAPAIIVSPPGTKRVGYAHEDTRWVTIHATQETDVDKIEAEVIMPDEEVIDVSGMLASIEGE